MTFTPRSRLRNSSVVPYVYFIQSRVSPHAIKIGGSQRPVTVMRQLAAATCMPLALVGAVRAYAVWVDILHRAFDTTAHAGVWIAPNASMLTLVAALKLRKPDDLLTADEMADVMRSCFPSRPDVWGIARYRNVEAMIAAARRGARA
jgi:hypothetical protein